MRWLRVFFAGAGELEQGAGSGRVGTSRAANGDWSGDWGADTGIFLLIEKVNFVTPPALDFTLFPCV